MELFDKHYNCYYQVVRHILEEAKASPITRRRMDELSGEYGFGESALTILPKLLQGQWPLLKPAGDGKWLNVCSPALPPPLTRLQKSWLKSLLFDPRIRLFLTDEEFSRVSCILADTQALYRREDFHYFDRYLDGDDYSSPKYRSNFRTILEAFRQNKALAVTYRSRNNAPSQHITAPCQLQYSPKDDKFRLCCLNLRRGTFSLNTVLNLSRIESCSLSSQNIPSHASSMRFRPIHPCREPVLLEISGERNSLERCMLHFANYEKRTQYSEEQNTWLCSIYYDMADETELLITILSFGPVVRVLGPEPFLKQIKHRVRRQHELLYSNLDYSPSPSVSSTTNK